MMHVTGLLPEASPPCGILKRNKQCTACATPDGDESRARRMIERPGDGEHGAAHRRLVHQLRPEVLELLLVERLREEVGGVLRRWDEGYLKLLILNHVPNIEVTPLYMLSATVELGII